MIACVDAMEAAFLPCLTEIEHKEPVPDYEAPLLSYTTEESISEPAEELNDTNDCPHPPLQANMEKHARDFMEAAQKLQRYFISLQQDDDHQPTKAEMLRKEIGAMEEELKKKNELIEKQERAMEKWKMELKDRLEEHNSQLNRV
ncbi:hypothetical protein ACOSQ3_019060 [Xanthoceras sorbifolium]